MCSVGLFNNTITYLKNEYGDKIVSEDEFNRLIDLLGKVEQIYNKMEDKID